MHGGREAKTGSVSDKAARVSVCRAWKKGLREADLRHGSRMCPHWSPPRLFFLALQRAAVPAWVRRSQEPHEKGLCFRVLKENINIVSCTFLGTPLLRFCSVQLLASTVQLRSLGQSTCVSLSLLA